MGRGVAPRGSVLILAVLLIGCSSAGPSSDGGESPASSASMTSSAGSPAAGASTGAIASVTPGSSLTPTRPSGPIVVDAFAEVVADQLRMRVAPGIDSEVLERQCHGLPIPRCPPAILGRLALPTPSTSVYVLDGPVTADGYDWYLVAEHRHGALVWDTIGWVAAGDQEDPWLVQREITCPNDPIELADVAYPPHSPLEVMHCLGGRELTLRGYYVDLSSRDGSEDDCMHQPAWLDCSPIGRILHLQPFSAEDLPLHLHPDVDEPPERETWIEVTGQFDHPAAADCGGGDPARVLGCRVAFVVTAARSQ